MLSAEELTGVQLFGERTVVVKGVTFTEPVAGVAAVRALVRRGLVQADSEVTRVLSDVGVGGDTVRLFMKRREVVRLPAELGGGLEARPPIPGIADDSLSNYTGSDDAFDRSFDDFVIDDKPRVYKLNSLFHDVTMTDKLQISSRRLQSAKRLALSDPAGAASALTDYVREHGFPNARITAGDYAKTISNAVEFIHAMGRTIVYRDACAPAAVTPKFLEMTFDQFSEKQPIWTVRGPLKYATEVNVVYQLAIHYGPEHVLFMLGSETIRLGIDIRDEVSQTYYNGMMAGYSSLSGIQPTGGGFPSELTADQQTRLLLAGRKVSPVRVGDAVIGSAVHVSDKHVILNEHTLTSAMQSEVVPEVCGLPIHESMSVAGDVCVVRRDGVPAQWLFRDPEVGERVVLCYSVGDSVEYSEVLQVTGCADQLILSGSNVLRRGASGAAVIALRDSALLGIFSTMRASRVFCALFSSSSFAVVSDCQSVASVSEHVSTPSLDAGDHTYAKMVKRGFIGFLEQIAQSVAPLYAQSYGRITMAGLVANVAGDWCTTADPDVAQLSMQDGRLLSFRSSVPDLFVAQAPPPVLQAVPNVRAVVPGERVFAFTKVDDDVIMSSVRMVTHVYTNNRGFTVEDFGDSTENMVGALMVAERDSAVLGQYVCRECDAFGLFAIRCTSFASVVPSEVGERQIEPRLVLSELSDWVLPVESVLGDYSDYGKVILNVAAGKQAYSRGGSLARGIASGMSLWNDKRRIVLEHLGWTVDAEVLAERYGFDAVALAYLALMYVHDAGGTLSKLEKVLSEHLQNQGTPITGDFPFLRPPSVTDSVVSARTVGAGSTDESRLRDLEERMSQLTDLVGVHGRRSNSFSVD